MNTNRILLSLAGLISFVALLIAIHKSRQVAAIREAIDQRHAEAVMIRDREQTQVDDLRSQLIARKEALEALKRDKIAAEAKPDQAFRKGAIDGEIARWLDGVDQLAEYSSVNEDLRIPELSCLTANDWLNATLSVNLKSEADFRAAMAKLRELAKARIAPKIKDAVVAYLEASGGEWPSYPGELVKFAEDAVQESIFLRYRIHPAGENHHRIRGREIVLEEADRPDELWYTTFIFDSDGSYVYFGHTNSKDMERISGGIKAFEEEHQRTPRNSQELAPFIESKREIENLDTLFTLMTTRPKLPSEKDIGS